MRWIVGILTMLCLLGASSGRDERTLDEPARAQLTQAKQLPAMAARRQTSALDAQLHDFTIVEQLELGERTHPTTVSIERTVSHRLAVPRHSVSSRGPPG